MSKSPWSLKNNNNRFFQDWSNTAALLTTNASTSGATAWEQVASIVGYRGDGLTSGVDPRTATGDGTQVVNLIANQSNPNTNTTGGVAEFDGIANPVVALQGSGTASAPNLVVYLDTTGEQNIAFSALLRDIDGSADNALQAVALQYRVGDAGAWTNIAYVADASGGPSLATLTTLLSATLPVEANNQALVEVRVITANAAGNDEWIGVDDITVTSEAITVPQPGNFSVQGASVAEGTAGTTTDIVFTVTRAGGSTGAADIPYTVNLPGIDGRAGTDDFATGTQLTGTVHFDNGDAASKEIRLTVQGDNRPEPNETFTVTLGTPSVGALATATATGTITNDDGNTLAIYDIQGLGHVSGFAGQVVNTAGVVTAVRSNGFYLQDASNNGHGDGDARTSDAIFVVASTANIVVGNELSLSGTVTEYRTSTANLPLTELTNVSALSVINASVALPEAVVIGTGSGERAPPTTVIDDDSLSSYDPTTDGLDFYESLEGMRVTVRTPLVVANTDGNGQTYVVASNGVGATYVSDRFGITISAGDNNPEKIKIYQGASAAGAHSQGDVLNDVSGILTVFGNSYEVDPSDPVTTGLDRAHLARETTTLTGDAGHLSYATFNVENFSPRVEDYKLPDEAYTLAYKLQALSTEIVSALGNPDVIGLQELQDNDGAGNGADYTATRTAQLLIDAIAAAGGPTYRYVEIAPTGNNISGGEPNGNIRNGYLYNPERVGYVDGSARVLTDAAYNGTRKPLLADFTFNGQVFTAADMHSTSRGGSDALFGAIQPPAQAGDAARTAQATALRNYIDGVLANDPAHRFVVNGDFNGYYYEPALQALQAGGKLVNLFDKLPVAERYSYYFDGYYQAFDNILVTGGLFDAAQVDVVHYNAGYLDGLSVTDHDQTLATLDLARGAGVAALANDAVSTTAAAAVRGNLLANDTGGGADLAVIAVNGGAIGTVRLASGALVTVGADGHFTYDADGAFSGLAAGATATDSFTYTAGGATATATVTVAGVAATAPTAGDDTVAGTTAADLFDLSAGGNDTVSGGAGDDGFFFGAAFTGADRVNGGSGTNDQVGIGGNYTGANRLVLAANTLTGVEVLALLPGANGTAAGYDIVWNDRAAPAGTRFSVSGNLRGAGENVTFDGSGETDASFLMSGGQGTDVLTGGALNDGFLFGPGKWGTSDVVHGGGGAADQIGLDGDYIDLVIDARMDVETVALLAGPADDRNSFSVRLDDGFAPAGATRTIYAAQVVTAVTIDASAEADGALRLLGGQAGDTITGGGGADMLFGGLGADTLRGGGGADVFQFNDAAQSTGINYDRLLDFDYAQDLVRIEGEVHDGILVKAGGVLDADAATFDAQLGAAVNGSLAHGSAVVFTADAGTLAGHSFLVIDANGVDGYQAGGDYVIEVTAPPPAPTDFIIA